MSGCGDVEMISPPTPRVYSLKLIERTGSSKSAAVRNVFFCLANAMHSVRRDHLEALSRQKPAGLHKLQTLDDSGLF